MGGCDISTNPTTSIKEIDQWNPSQDIPIQILKKSPIWPKFNNSINFELICIEAFQKPVEWHIAKLTNCVEYFAKELTSTGKEKDREELAKYRDMFQRRVEFLGQHERAIGYLIRKGFKINNSAFSLAEVNLTNIWEELFPLGYYFRSEDDQIFFGECTESHLAGLPISSSLYHSLSSLIARNLPLNHLTSPLYLSLCEYFSIPFPEILQRAAALFAIHQLCHSLISSADTPLQSTSDLTSSDSDFSDDDSDNGDNCSSLSICRKLSQNDLQNDLHNDEDDDNVSENESEEETSYLSDSERADCSDPPPALTPQQLSLLTELRNHSLNKSTYLLRLKRTLRIERKRNFNLAGERRRHPTTSPLSLLSLTNNLHVGENIDSLDPGHRCIYRKCYHIYKLSLDSALLQSFSSSLSPSLPLSSSFSKPPSAPVTPISHPSIPHLHHTPSSPAPLLFPSSSSFSAFCHSPPFKHLPFFVWLEGKQLEAVKQEKYYHWDLIPSTDMKITFKEGGIAHHPLFNCRGESSSLTADCREDRILDGVYIYAVDENDDLFVLPKVPEDERERRELDLTSLNILKQLYPDYLLFPNHPRLIHSANGRSLGEISFLGGKIQQISNVSGHYRPHGYQFYLAVLALCKHGEIFNDDGQVFYRHSAGTDVFTHSQFLQLDKREMMLDVIKGKDRRTGLEYHVKCNCC